MPKSDKSKDATLPKDGITRLDELMIEKMKAEGEIENEQKFVEALKANYKEVVKKGKILKNVNNKLKQRSKPRPEGKKGNHGNIKLSQRDVDIRFMNAKIKANNQEIKSIDKEIKAKVKQIAKLENKIRTSRIKAKHVALKERLAARKVKAKARVRSASGPSTKGKQKTKAQRISNIRSSGPKSTSQMQRAARKGLKRGPALSRLNRPKGPSMR